MKTIDQLVANLPEGSVIQMPLCMLPYLLELENASDLNEQFKDLGDVYLSKHSLVPAE